MSGYRGMRWFKCDLQVQTPEDNRHWRDDDLRLGDPRRPKREGKPDESGIQEKARRFLKRCHELGLEVIGFTDHNFSNQAEPRDWFLTHLVEQNKRVAKELDRPPLHLFPGFEADIGYHALCLFEPAVGWQQLQTVNEILTKLGLRPGERFVEGKLQPLRYNDASVSLKRLLEIVQNECGGVVIAAHADERDGLLSDASRIGDYSLKDLFAVELTSNPPAQKYRDILAGKNTHWKREGRHPGWIMSSDAKSLAIDEAGFPTANALGYRYSWIKMSSPSIESLRQAFLDHASRIRVPENPRKDENPNDLQKQARICSISVEGVDFLEDQEIEFSPNMSCVIGGRGSGKSTVLEYLRMALGKDKTEDVDEETRVRIERIRKTRAADRSRITVRWRDKSGTEDVILLEGGRPVVSNRELIDEGTFFRQLPVSFFSQQQLNRLTQTKDRASDQRRQAQQLTSLIDAFVADELRQLEHAEIDKRREIESLFAKRREVQSLAQEEKRARQEHQEAERQWKARSEIQAEAQRHQHAKAAAEHVSRLRESLGEPERIAELARSMAENHSPIGSAAAHWPHGEWFAALDGKAEQLKEKFARTVENAVASYKQEIDGLFALDPVWPEIERELAVADQRFERACREKGLSPEDVGRLQEIDRQRLATKTAVARYQSQITVLNAAINDLPARFDQLHDIWHQQFRLRATAADLANDATKLNESGGRFIHVAPSYCGAREALQAIWSNFEPPDRRTKLGRSWEEIGELVFDSFQTNVKSYRSPWAMLQEWIDSPGKCSDPQLRERLVELKEHVDQHRQAWERIQVTRVPDAVDLTLFRPDGTQAGSISDGSLSDGQRNTAALALLLAQDGGPLVIDQPEDELDSNFIFKELIPMLRGVKQKRQILLATHNANLVVNGDSELVYALEATKGRGTVLAQGGLDRPEVTRVVLDVMEGSEEAFRRRYEKYHF
ncbi:MAG: AAA family ATPase [Thermoanaerobaculia bacterium]|nr:AAA family ATPase [Thermoanaerobaculia bacterium]